MVKSRKNIKLKKNKTKRNKQKNLIEGTQSIKDLILRVNRIERMLKISHMEKIGGASKITEWLDSEIYEKIKEYIVYLYDEKLPYGSIQELLYNLNNKYKKSEREIYSINSAKIVNSKPTIQISNDSTEKTIIIEAPGVDCNEKLKELKSLF